jgi:hypothetical protein
MIRKTASSWKRWKMNLYFTNKCFNCRCDLHWCVCPKIDLQVSGEELATKLCLVEVERDDYMDKYHAARAERDRLRKALEEIARYLHIDVYPIIKTQIIARTALKETKV